VPVGKREIARAFKVPPAERVALKGLIKDVASSGTVERGTHRRFAPTGALPEIGIVEITGVDFDGDVHGKPVGWTGGGAPPEIIVLAERGAPALGTGERAVVRFSRGADGYEARIIRAIGGAPDRVLGV
jgi:ribonuclease R